jgi:hypothetical protein
MQPLDVPTWCTAKQAVQLQYIDLFEVHGGVSVKQQLPPYSEAFRGYGLNKQQHVWHAAALGFTFKVGEHSCMLASSSVCLLEEVCVFLDFGQQQCVDCEAVCSLLIWRPN